MEDETIVTNTEHNNSKRIYCNPIAKTIGCGILIFLGAFCAFYTVADWYMKNLFAPFNPHHIDRMLEHNFHEIDKTINSETKKNSHIIHLEENDNYYKVIIDLRAFDNNVNNVQIKRDGNILTINGRNIKKSKNNQQISEFQQSYMFGDNVNLREMTKETQGNLYIIKIPTIND